MYNGEYEIRKVLVEFEIEVNVPKGADDDDINTRLEEIYCADNFALSYLNEYSERNGCVCDLVTNVCVVPKGDESNSVRWQ